ncbi:MAG: DUF4123 domain-containing protein [Aquabacterium sp.]
MDEALLAQQLWPSGSGPESPQAYVLLDGARDPRIASMVSRGSLPHVCLYAGPLSPALSRAAPYLVQIAPESRFFKELVAQSWGQSWGIFIVADPHVTLQALRRHLRTLLRVRDEHGRTLVFRFYDPRVLRVYLPTCTADERRQVFGPIRTLACETRDGSALLRFGAVDFVPAPV